MNLRRWIVSLCTRRKAIMKNRRKKFKSLRTACSFAKQDETFTYKAISSRFL